MPPGHTRSAYRTFFYAPSVVVSLSEMGLSLSIYHSHGFLAQSLSLLWLYVCPPQNLFLCSGGSSRMFFAVAQLLLKGWMVVNSRVLCWRLRGHGSFTLSVMYLLNGSVYSPANDVKLRTERSQWHGIGNYSTMATQTIVVAFCNFDDESFHVQVQLELSLKLIVVGPSFPTPTSPLSSIAHPR